MMFGGGLWWMAHLTTDSDFWELFGPLVLRGSSIMLIILPANQITLGRLPPLQVKNASGLYNLMRNLGGTVGLAMIDTVATSRLASHTQRLQEQVTWTRPAALRAMDNMTHVLGATNAGNAHLAALKRIAGMVHQQALALTYNDVLQLMAGCFFLALPLTLMLSRPSEAVVETH
jgi:DHA2 family multidrug resistance protein